MDTKKVEKIFKGMTNSKKTHEGVLLIENSCGDFSYNFQDELKWTKSMKPRFEPNKKGKSYYADVNFDLLGKIIEKINCSTLQEAYNQYIFKPLNLKNTYLASKGTDFIPQTYFKNQRLERPLFIRSSFASGGAITTARELMIFLKAFWKGELFDKSIFSKLTQSNKLQLSFTPIRYGAGFMKINASMPFSKKVELIGHSGSTGAFAFYCPDKDLFFVGDVPQIADPSICIRLVMKCAIVI